MSVKSLTDTCVEYLAINFTEFVAKLEDPSTSSQIYLPPHIFEEILLKSKEFGLVIPSGVTVKCFLYRDVLRWDNIDVSLIHHELDAFESMRTVKYPVKKLSLFVVNVNDAIVDLISKLGSELTSLELSYIRGFITEFSIERFPKLQRLVLRKKLSSLGGRHHKSFLTLDFGHHSEVLKEVKVENEIIDISLINSLKSLSNLRTLSVSKCTFEPQQREMCVTELGALKTLRTLNLSHMDLAFDDPILYNMQEKLTNLENFDISMSKIGSMDLQLLMNISYKKLKKLGIYGVSDVDDDKVKDLAEMVFAKYRRPTFESLLSNAAYYSRDPFSDKPFWATDLLRAFSLSDADDQTSLRVQNIVLDAFHDYIDDEDLRRDMKSFYHIPSFVLKVVLLLCSAKKAHFENGLASQFHKPDYLLLDEDVFSFIKDYVRDGNQKLAGIIAAEVESIPELKGQSLFDFEIEELWSQSPLEFWNTHTFEAYIRKKGIM